MSNQNRQLYIVISQTGTLLSRILKQITGAEYNHASISLSRDLERMYSFGRRHPYNPFWGGFVIESPRTGTSSVFPKPRCWFWAWVSQKNNTQSSKKCSMWCGSGGGSTVTTILAYVWHTSMLSGSRRAAIIAQSLSESFSQKVGLTARNSYVPLLYSRCSSLECRTHCSTAENFANMWATPVPRAYVKMQQITQCIGDCHNSR